MCIGDCLYNYTIQPPTSYPCNPHTGLYIELPCVIDSDSTYTTDWYYTTDPTLAGRAGINLTLGGVSDAYMLITPVHSMQPQLLFIVSSETVGYYWCKIRDEGARPSTVISICDADFYNVSVSLCESPNDLRYYYAHRDTECAAVDGPTVFPRPSLPEDCVSPAPSMSSSDIIDLSLSSSFLPPSTPLLHTTLLHTTVLHTTVLSTSTSVYLSPSITQSSVDDSLDATLLLYILIGVCGVLAIVAIVIMIVIIVLCKLSNSHTSELCMVWLLVTVT